MQLLKVSMGLVMVSALILFPAIFTRFFSSAIAELICPLLI
jgi:hypothetical protein